MRTTVSAYGGRTVVSLGNGYGASAEISDTGSETRVQFCVGAGHVPDALRAELVDAVFGLPELGHGRRLHAAVPIGDAQLIDLLRRRCLAVEMRAAGATVLIDAQTR